MPERSDGGRKDWPQGRLRRVGFAALKSINSSIIVTPALSSGMCSKPFGKAR
jgi:hypothetical protein